MMNTAAADKFDDWKQNFLKNAADISDHFPFHYMVI